MRKEPTPCRSRAWWSAPSPITVNPWIAMALLAAGFATGCETIFSGEEEGEVMATIDFSRGAPSPDTVVVLVPDTVGAGQSFPVTIRTYYGCLLEEGRTQIDVHGPRLDVTPYMRTISRKTGEICPDFLGIADRIVHLRFTSSGVGTVTVFGLNDITYPSFGSARQADTIRVERSVVVR